MDENVEHKLKLDASGGNGSGGNIRIGAKTPDDAGGAGVPRVKKTRLSVRPRRTVHTDGSKRVHISNMVTILELANRMDVSQEEVARKLMILNKYRCANQLIEVDVAQQIALDMGYELS